MTPVRMVRIVLGASAVLASAAVTASVSAQQPKPFEFTIANMMRGQEVYGREPQRVRWSADGQWLYFQWLPPGTSWREPARTYRVRAASGATPERVSDAQLDTVGPLLETGVLSPDRRQRAVSYDGDLYVIDVAKAAARRLTLTAGTETSPGWSSDGRMLYFVRDNNVFTVELATGFIRQLTDIRPGPAPQDPAKPTPQRAVLERQQQELFGVLRDQAWRDSIAKAEREEREGRRIKPVYLLRDERITALSTSPNGGALVFTTTITTPNARQAKVPNYVTLDGYTEDLVVRTKVGDAQAGGRVGFMKLPGNTVQWLRVVPGDTTRAPAFVNAFGWRRDGTSAILFAEADDHKARYIHRVDAADGKLTTIDVLRDSAWVGGPCYPCAGWSADGTRIWFVSEADGFAHLYATDDAGQNRKQLTSGKFEVLDVQLSNDSKFFELHTSEGSPFERHFDRMPFDGGPRERITTEKGGHTAVVSPDGRMLADVYSTSNRPPELFLQPYRAGAPMTRLTTSPAADFLAFKWLSPEIVTIPASDGVAVPARIFQPKDMGAQPNGAAVIFVHGAGYLHNVHSYWTSSYPREFMFNHYLASRGYVVLDIDYRGSAGYGRDWRTAIYRWMGGRDLQDHVDGSRYLQKTFGISPDRIGLYGGSYGGFITLMALFTAPKDFGAGAGLRSVTDWAHYNDSYTSRILNDPQVDTLAYRRSSPIFFAEGLEDPLLMAHGMVDTNVHFQDIVRLSQRLIELRKTGWELAPYPVENHGFERPDSWADEYRRIFELFEAHLPQRATSSSTGAQSKP